MLALPGRGNCDVLIGQISGGAGLSGNRGHIRTGDAASKASDRLAFEPYLTSEPECCRLAVSSSGAKLYGSRLAFG